MTGLIKTITFLAIALIAIELQPLAQADSLDAILTRMDASAKNFKTVTADLKKIEYTAVLKDTEESSGVLQIKRDKNAVMAITKYTKPDEQTQLIKDKKAYNYSPKAKMVQEYDLAKYSSGINQFLLLAFGTSGDELRKTFDVKLAGAESIGGTATTRLELTPKSEDVKRLCTRIDLWIPEGKSNAIREKIFTPSENYFLIEYSNIKPNVELNDSIFDAKWPKDVKVNKVSK